MPDIDPAYFFCRIDCLQSVFLVSQMASHLLYNVRPKIKRAGQFQVPGTWYLIKFFNKI